MLKKCLLMLTIIVVLTSGAVPVLADSPSPTFTIGKDGHLVYTQTAYQPVAVIDGYKLEKSSKDVPLSSPEDIFIENGKLYIADTGNARIIVMDTWGHYLTTVGEETLKKPTGIFVDQNGDIYVADPRAGKVFKFNKAGKLVKTYGKPDSLLFGEGESFKPLKVVLSKNGTLDIVGKGIVQGLIQMSPDGRFLGFFGGNRTGFDFVRSLKEKFYTREQMRQLLTKLPPSVTNVAVDDKGLIYTITTGEEVSDRLKKLNVAGQNLLEHVFTSSNLADVTVDNMGNIFAVDGEYGYVFEYDKNGNMLFTFGWSDFGNPRLGLFKSPSGIAVSQDGRLFILDKKRENVQIFKTTRFANLVQTALGLFQKGKYLESEEPWHQVLRLNSMFALAHTGLGMVALKKHNYEEAAKQFKLAGNQDKYSQAYWEIRRNWMLQYGTWAILGISFFIVAFTVVKALYRKYRLGHHVVNTWRTFCEMRLASKLLHSFRMLRHPLDGYYEIESEGKASVFSATLLYILIFFVHIYKLYQTNFIFSSTDSDQINIMTELYRIYLPIIAWLICNYFVSTINDGEGAFKNVYKGTAYAFSPYLIFTIPLTVVSNGLTNLEAVIYNFSERGIYIWTGLLLFLMVKEIHGYEFKGTIKNIFITLFGMATMAVTAFILFGLSSQVVNFVYAIIEEVKLRVS